MTRADALQLLRSLNEEQSAVFYKIRQWCLQKVNGENPVVVVLTAPTGVAAYNINANTKHNTFKSEQTCPYPSKT